MARGKTGTLRAIRRTKTNGVTSNRSVPSRDTSFPATSNMGDFYRNYGTTQLGGSTSGKS